MAQDRIDPALPGEQPGRCKHRFESLNHIKAIRRTLDSSNIPEHHIVRAGGSLFLFHGTPAEIRGQDRNRDQHFECSAIIKFMDIDGMCKNFSLKRPTIHAP